jgi:hypothetical protein
MSRMRQPSTTVYGTSSASGTPHMVSISSGLVMLAESSKRPALRQLPSPLCLSQSFQLVASSTSPSATSEGPMPPAVLPSGTSKTTTLLAEGSAAAPKSHPVSAINHMSCD